MEITKVRVHRRYPIRIEIGLRHKGELAYRKFVAMDVSRGGLFLQSNEPLKSGEILDVRLPAQDGDIDVECEVRHVMDVELSRILAHSVGAGLMFVGMNMIKAEAIQRYVDQIHMSLGFDDEPRSGMISEHVSSVDAEDESIAAMAGRAVSSWLQGKDCYSMLDLPPESSQAEVKTRIMQLQKVVDKGLSGMALPGKLSKEDAEEAIRRLGRLMLNPISRLQYDFRCGQIRAEQRIEAAKNSQGQSATMLRRVWLETYPEYAEEADQYALAAQEAAAEGKYTRAVRRAQVALEADPFNVELRELITEWQSKADS